MRSLIHGNALALNCVSTVHLHGIAVTWFRFDSLEMALIFQEIAGINKGVKLGKRLGPAYF